MSEQQDDPLLDIAHGDQARSKHLQDSLKVLRGHTTDDKFKQLIDNVLSGKESLRDAVTSDVFGRAVTPLAEQAVEKLHTMSDSEKEALETEGQRQLDDLNRELIEKGTSQQVAAQRTSVDEHNPDDDGEDFSDGSFLLPVR